MAAAWLPALASILSSAYGAYQSSQGRSSQQGAQSQDEFQKLPTMTGGQEGLLQQLLSGLGGSGGAMGLGMGNLSQLLSGSPDAFKAFEAPAMRQFQQQIIPSIAERFSGLGSGSQGSSAFGQQMGAAGAGLSEQLAALRGNLQQNALQQLLGFGQLGLGSQAFGYGHRTPQPGFLQSLMPGLAQGVSTALTSYGLNKLG